MGQWSDGEAGPGEVLQLLRKEGNRSWGTCRCYIVTLYHFLTFLDVDETLISEGWWNEKRNSTFQAQKNTLKFCSDQKATEVAIRLDSENQLILDVKTVKGFLTGEYLAEMYQILEEVNERKGFESEEMMNREAYVGIVGVLVLVRIAISLFYSK